MKKFSVSVFLLFIISTNLLAQSARFNENPDPLLNIDKRSTNNFDATQIQQGKKSVFLATTLSLLLPGAGEWYIGDVTSARYHMIAEGAIWTTYTAFYLRSKWLLDDAKIFAKIHAGASFNGTDDDYNVNIGNFLSVEEYNNARLRDRDYNALYLDSKYYWQWDTDENRQQFKTNRIKSSEAKNYSRFVVAFAIINRIVSAFRASRLAAKHNTSLLESFDVKFQHTHQYSTLITVTFSTPL